MKYDKKPFPKKREYPGEQQQYSGNRTTRNESKPIIDLVDGDYFEGLVKILRKSQPGPVIFTVSDGYGTADAVTKNSEFQAGNVVKLSGEVIERAGKIQIEIFRMERSDADFSEIIKKNSEPVRKTFSIESERYEKLRYRFIDIARRIRKAILENQSIMIRHHADSDGIISGLVIEHSCKRFIEKIGLNPDFNVYRSPSKAPFYEVSDVFRDIVLSKRLIEGHGQEKPLIVVLDNGSTPEDVTGLKILKNLGYEVIVIDHHNPVIIKDKKTAVDPYLSFHLNPYIEGLDSQTSAGMLSYEVARFIFEDFDGPLYPAVAAISDRTNIQETQDYIKNTGKERAFLEKIGIAIDFIAYNLKYDAGKGLFEELFTKQELVKTINEEVQKGVETQLQSTMPYLRTQDIEGITFSTIDIEKYTVRFKYPNPGKVVGMIHDLVAEGKENMPVITIGYLSDMTIIRATKPVLPVQKIMDNLKKKFPQANIDGGGHECAGTIKFVPAHLNAVLEEIKEQIKALHYMTNLKDDESCRI
ncbi:MAG: hypothetical protein Q7S33_02170 [Nanoarchaeota archaeon]|nr:hypothetical protein [Nanoarchaeota archaeon]